MTRERTMIGIDLGTTYSLVATLNGAEPRVLPNRLGEYLTPSAVSVEEDGTVLVGAAARARATTHPAHTALAFKRDMGTGRIFELGKKRMTPQELSALILGELKRDAEAVLGRPIDEAIVTVPAYFGDLQRHATRDAAAIAGLHVERIINEPTAAALAYGLHDRMREARAVVLDLGGGTFDVTILEIMEGVIEIQASAGDARLGGEDLDDALTERIAARIREEHRVDLSSDPRARARLRDACERAKRDLSEATTARLALHDLPMDRGRLVDIELTITRDEAEAAWLPILARMRDPIVRAMRDASVSAQKIDDVLLVGGSTRMPCVARFAAQMFGKLPLRNLPPDEAVAMGAAIQAGLKQNDAAVGDLVVTDVAPFTLGILTASGMGEQMVDDVFAPILERGTVIPASRVKRFQTVSAFQKEIRVKVYQGEHSLCTDNTLLGEYLVRGLASKPAGEEAIDVRFTYDLNGILEVETTVLSSGKNASLVIESRQGRLTADQIAKARAAMAGLKFHPREALPNTTALARADALFVDLSGNPREVLGLAIASFRQALEAQRREEIEPMRARLISLIDDLRRHR